MLAAAGWGLVGGAALVLGAAIGLLTRPSQRTIGLVMAFGAGVLISVPEAFEHGGGVVGLGPSAALRRRTCSRR